MALFSRFRRGQHGRHADAAAENAAAARSGLPLPRVNQRVTVLTAGHEPVPSRVEDEVGDTLVIASPNFPLEENEPVVVSWETEDGWYSLRSTVVHVDEHQRLPTVAIHALGNVSFHDERRSSIRREVALDLYLQPVLARVVKPGRDLRTHTVDIGTRGLTFTSSAPLAPGDVLEGRLVLTAGEPIGTRLRVIRVDSVQGSWRQAVTAVFEEMLRSDRGRLAAFLQAMPQPEHVVDERELPGQAAADFRAGMH